MMMMMMMILQGIRIQGRVMYCCYIINHHSEVNSYDSALPHYVARCSHRFIATKMQSFRCYICQTALETRRWAMVLTVLSDSERKKEGLIVFTFFMEWSVIVSKRFCDFYSIILQPITEQFHVWNLFGYYVTSWWWQNKIWLRCSQWIWCVNLCFNTVCH